MFKRHDGGTTVKGGFYWHTADWEIVTVEGRKGMLPGGAESRYVRLPTLLFIPFALTLGALYYIFLPFIGFAMLLALIGRKTGKGLLVLVPAIQRRLAGTRRTVNPVVGREAGKPVQMAGLVD